MTGITALFVSRFVEMCSAKAARSLEMVSSFSGSLTAEAISVEVHIRFGRYIFHALEAFFGESCRS